MHHWGIQSIFKWSIALVQLNNFFTIVILSDRFKETVWLSLVVFLKKTKDKKSTDNFYTQLHIKSPINSALPHSHFLSSTPWLHRNGIVFRGECEKKLSLIGLYIQTGKGVEKWCSRFHLTELVDMQPFSQPLRWKRTWRLCFVNGTQRHIPAPQCWRALLRLRQEWANAMWTDI